MRALSLLLVACATPTVAPVVHPAPELGPIEVRVEWPNGSRYRGGIGWVFDGSCAGKTVHFKSRDGDRFAGSAFFIDWPTACGDAELDVDLDIIVNWMRCEPPPRTHQRVRSNGKIIIRLATSPTCKEHEDDP